MEAALHRFARLLRRSGMRVSVSEVVDAMRAAAEPGVLADRLALHAGMSVCLVKDRRDQAVFDEIFEAFFHLAPAARGQAEDHGHAHDDLSDTAETADVTVSPEPSQTPRQGHSHGKPADLREHFKAEDMAQQFNLHQEADTIDMSAMTDELVLSTDPAGSLAAAARVQLTTTRLHGAGAPGDLAATSGRAVDVELTVAEELALIDWLAGELNHGADGPDEALLDELRRRLGGVLGELPELLRRYLETLMALERRAIELGEIRAAGVDRVSAQDRLELEEALRRLVRSLHGAPRARRRVTAAGRVDGGRTLRSSMRYDGIPFRPITVSRAHDRPRLLVLADVSLSVRATARFTLNLVHGLQSLTSHVRSFAFVADLVEITDLFAEHPMHEALGLVMGGLPAGGVLDIDTDSDYGAAFGAFVEGFGSAIHRRSTVVVLGDGRGNGRDPNLPAFAEITRRARETFWLTPEPSYSWGLGGCDLPAYAEHCTRVHVVRDLSGLDRVSRMMATAAG